jgi:type VI secretion system protein ImpC
MSDRSRAGIEMNFAFGKGTKPKVAASENTPFRMLVIGDFGGHASRAEVRPGSAWRPQRVDIDSLPALFGTIAPRIQVRLGDQAPFTIAVQDLDGFHPDQLFDTHEFFAPMRELRRQLQDPKTFALAAALLGKGSTPASSDMASHGVDLERLLGKSTTAPTAAPVSALDALIREAVAPHIVGKTDPRQAELVAAVDGMTGELMRSVLHDPGFQRVEAAWRGLDRMIRGLELDQNLQVFVLDVSREELAQDFAAAANLTDSAIYRIVVDHGGGKPWSLLVEANAYGRKQEDAALLARLGAIAMEEGAAVVAGVDWATWSSGLTSLEDQRAWSALRGSPAAMAIGIAVPSILLRLPYGKDTESIERFIFTEQTLPPAPERYLWGSAALAVGQLVARSYQGAGGWDFSPGDETSLDDLPVHTVKHDGESVQTPCAQTWLPESKMDALIKEGVMPVISAQGRGEVRFPRFQSIASPPAALVGRWRND